MRGTNRLLSPTCGALVMLLASAAVTAGVWLLIAAGIPITNPAVFYFPVVILGTLFFNWQVATLAAPAAVLLSNYFLTAPSVAFSPVGTAATVTDAIIVVSNGLVIFITTRLKHARSVAERLTQEVRDLYELETKRRESAELFLL